MFRGPLEAGHWALLVVDRTRESQDLLVFFDSLPGFCADSFDNLQVMLSKTPITNGQTKWIRAEMPRQAACTNDCGVWMCCVAAAYVAELLQQSLLEENEERGRRKTNLVSKVSVSTVMAEKELGRMGRRHMLNCIRNNTYNKEEINIAAELGIIFS